MLRSYLVIAWRDLVRHKVYSLINIAGLALGMACCILVQVYVEHEMSYDHFFKKASRIYRLVTADGPAMPASLAPLMVEELPEVEEAVRITTPKRNYPLISRGEVQRYQYVYFADANIFDVFDFPFVCGDPRTALQNPYTMVISTCFYFPVCEHSLSWDIRTGRCCC